MKLPQYSISTNVETNLEVQHRLPGQLMTETLSGPLQQRRHTADSP